MYIIKIFSDVPCAIILLTGGRIPFTAIVGYPRPNIPSNLAATKVSPGSSTASANF